MSRKIDFNIVPGEIDVFEDGTLDYGTPYFEIVVDFDGTKSDQLTKFGGEFASKLRKFIDKFNVAVKKYEDQLVKSKAKAIINKKKYRIKCGKGDK